MLLMSWLQECYGVRHSVRRRSSLRAALRNTAAVESLEDRALLTAFVVNSADDTLDTTDNMVTLRDAIFAANNDVSAEVGGDSGEADGDTITFNATVFGNGGTITLLNGEFLITDDLSIDGSINGTPVVTINAVSASRVFNVIGGVGEPVQLSSLTLQNGLSTGDGGAILINSLDVTTLTAVNITNSVSTGNGGAIAISGGGTVSFVGGTLSGNTANGTGAASGGGAIYSTGEGVLNVSGFAQINNNTANGNGASGGGIYIEGTLNAFAGTQLDSNMASRAGGGIEVAGAAGRTVNLTNVSLLNNSATAGGTDPGNGGGLHITGMGTVTVTASTIQGNSAIEGGGLWNSAAATLIVLSGTDVLGGQAVDTTFVNNTALGTLSDQGGGAIYNDGGTVQVTGATLLSNIANGVGTGTAGSGGGLLSIAGNVTVTNTTFAGNVAKRAGGGIELIIGNVLITGSSFTGNNTGGNPGNGGALHVTGAASVTISSTNVSNNSAKNEGGGVWNSASGNMTINNSTIGNNFSTRGGGVFNNGGTMGIVQTAITRNTALNGDGGGVFSLGGSVTIQNTTIGGNVATGTGLGGGVRITGGTASLNGATVALNSGVTGGGLSSSAGTFYVLNTIVASNTGSGAPNIDGTIVSGGYNVIGTTTGATITGDSTGNKLNADAKLGSLQNNGGTTETFALLAGSAARDAGNSAATNTALTVDQRGVTRPQGFRKDIGAFESTGTAVLGPNGRALIAVATGGAGVQGGVALYDGVGALAGSFAPFAGYNGILHVALGDVSGDGIQDIIVGVGEGSLPRVKVFDGRDLTGATVIGDFLAYAAGFTGGVWVAAGDVNGTLSVVTGSGAGAAADVRVISGANLMPGADPAGRPGQATATAAFAPYSFTGGARVAVGDFDGDGNGEVAVAPGAGADSTVRIYAADNATGGALISGFSAFPTGYSGGVYLSAADVAGSTRSELIVSREQSSGTTIPQVAVYGFTGTTSLTATSQTTFNAYSGFGGGVRVGVQLDATGDGKSQIVTAPGPGARADIRAYKLETPSGSTTLAATLINQFFASDALNGAFVGV